MSVIESYYLGGYKPAAPAKNRAELYDSAAGTYTHWDTAGNVLTQRPLTSNESAQLAVLDAQITASANDATLRQRASAALTANATYLAIANPSVAQNTAQLKTVTKECNAVIRLLLGQLDDISGT